MTHSIAAYKSKLLKKIHSRKSLWPSLLKSLYSFKKATPNKSINEAEYIVLDTELTGLNLKTDSIISIGALKMTGGRINVSNFFYRIVKPKAKVKGESIIIHGITPTEASECPDINTLLPEFLDFCKDSIIVGHFISIDMGFINRGMKKLYGSTMSNPMIDTHKIYQWIRQKEERSDAFYVGKPEDAGLFKLARQYEIPVKGMHNALNDAFVAAQLFQRFLSLLKGFGIRTTRDLLLIGKP